MSDVPLVLIGAPLYRRLHAALIDGALVFCGFLFVSLPFVYVDVNAATPGALLFLFAYFFLGWRFKHGTFGKSIAGTRLSRSDGNDLDFSGFIRRSLVAAFIIGGLMSIFFVGLPFLVRVALLTLTLISFVFSLFDVQRRTLHDILAGSLVVSKNAEPAPLILTTNDVLGSLLDRRISAILLCIFLVPPVATLLTIGAEAGVREIYEFVKNLETCCSPNPDAPPEL